MNKQTLICSWYTWYSFGLSQIDKLMINFEYKKDTKIKFEKKILKPILEK